MRDSALMGAYELRIPLEGRETKEVADVVMTYLKKYSLVKTTSLPVVDGVMIVRCRTTSLGAIGKVMIMFHYLRTRHFPDVVIQ